MGSATDPTMWPFSCGSSPERGHLSPPFSTCVAVGFGMFHGNPWGLSTCLGIPSISLEMRPAYHARAARVRAARQQQQRTPSQTSPTQPNLGLFGRLATDRCGAGR
jgi:hypothetical protein